MHQFGGVEGADESVVVRFQYALGNGSVKLTGIYLGQGNESW